MYWEGLNQCIEKAFLPGTLTVGLTLWAGANNLSNFYVSCVWKNLTRKGQLQKSREGIVLEEALCCENEFFTLTATLVPHNRAVGVCKWTHLHEINKIDMKLILCAVDDIINKFWQKISWSLMLNIEFTDLKTTHFCVVFLALSTTSDPNLRENRQWANPDPKS